MAMVFAAWLIAPWIGCYMSIYRENEGGRCTHTDTNTSFWTTRSQSSCYTECILPQGSTGHPALITALPPAAEPRRLVFETLQLLALEVTADQDVLLRNVVHSKSRSRREHSAHQGSFLEHRHIRFSIISLCCFGVVILCCLSSYRNLA